MKGDLGWTGVNRCHNTAQQLAAVAITESRRRCVLKKVTIRAST